MRRILFIIGFVTCFCVSSACATEQSKEILYYYEMQTLQIEELPLESYFNEKNLRPNFEDITGDQCTSGRRGYRGYWDIQEKYLYLVSLIGPCSSLVDSQLLVSKIFPNLKFPIKAIWFSGVLHAQYKGKILELIFENGKLIKEEIKEHSSADTIKIGEPLFPRLEI